MDVFEKAGLRLTPQRESIYRVVAASHDHPTAEDIFHRAQSAMPDLAFATVYNCLGTLVRHGLVKQVNIDPASARYCPNLREHSHFVCEKCEGVFDIPLQQKAVADLPAGFTVHSLETAIKGLCPDCSGEGERLNEARLSAQN